MTSSFQPRDWQLELLEEYQRQRKFNFLVEACVSAGKTPASINIYESLKDDYGWKFLVVVVPSEHLQGQFAQDAWNFFGLNLYYGKTDKTVRELIRDGYQGLVITYQFIAANKGINAMLLSKSLRDTCNGRVFVIIDEVHHASDQLAYGQACEIAFPNDVVSHRLMTTGTPYRSDNNKILGNWLTYEPTSDEEDGKFECKPHFRYTIDRALADGIIPPFSFATLDGEFTYKRDGFLYEGKSFDKAQNQQELSDTLNTAIYTEGDWINEAIKWAHNRMKTDRAKGFPEAATYVRSRNIKDAYRMAERIRTITGEKALVVVSSSDEGSEYISFVNKTKPSALIKEFAEGKGAGCQSWIIGVGILGEGVSINRLVYRIHATNITQRLSFMQDLGRLLRPFPVEAIDRQRFLPVETLIPSHPILIQLAIDALNDIAHVIQDQTNPEDDLNNYLDPDGEGNENIHSLSTFIPLTSTGVEGDHILGTGETVEIYYVRVAEWAKAERGWHNWAGTPADLGNFFKQNPSVFAAVEAEYKAGSTAQTTQSNENFASSGQSKPPGFSADYPSMLPKQKAEEASRQINNLVKKLVKALNPDLDTKSEEYGKQCGSWHVKARNSTKVPQGCQDHKELEKIYTTLSNWLDKAQQRNKKKET